MRMTMREGFGQRIWVFSFEEAGKRERTLEHVGSVCVQEIQAEEGGGGGVGMSKI